MHDIIKTPLIISRNDVNNLTKLQIEKAKYWFKTFLDLYNNDLVSWNDIEFQLVYYMKLANDYEFGKRLYDSTHVLWRFMKQANESELNTINFNEFLEIWASITKYIQLNNHLPDIFVEWFRSAYDLYTAPMYTGEIIIGGSNSLATNSTFDDILNQIITVITSEKSEDESYKLVPGLNEHLKNQYFNREDYYHLSRPDEYVNVSSENGTSSMDSYHNGSLYTNDFNKSNSSISNSSFSYSDVNGYKREHQNSINGWNNANGTNGHEKNYYSNSETNLNEIMYDAIVESNSDNQLVPNSLNNILEITAEHVKKAYQNDSDTKIPHSVQMNDDGSRIVFDCDESTAEDLVKKLMSGETDIDTEINKQKTLSASRNSIAQSTQDEIQMPPEILLTNGDENTKVSIFFDKHDPASKVEYVIKPTLNRRYRRSNILEEYKGSSENLSNLLSVQKSHVSRSTGDLKRASSQQNFFREFKHSRSNLARSYSGDMNDDGSRSISRSVDIRKEFKRGHRRSSNYVSESERSRSKVDISKEFKRSRSNLDLSPSFSIRELEESNKTSKNDIRKEFKRSRHSLSRSFSGTHMVPENEVKENIDAKGKIKKEFKAGKGTLIHSDSNPIIDRFLKRNNLSVSNCDMKYSTNSLDSCSDSTYSMNQVPIQNPRLLALRNGDMVKLNYSNHEIGDSVAPIKFPRSDYPNIRGLRKRNIVNQYMNAGGFINDSGRTYSTQSLPEMDENDLKIAFENRMNPTLSLHESSPSQPKRLRFYPLQNDNLSKPKRPKMEIHMLEPDEYETVHGILKSNSDDSSDRDKKNDDDSSLSESNNNDEIQRSRSKAKSAYLSSVFAEMKVKSEFSKNAIKPILKKDTHGDNKLKVKIEGEKMYEVLDGVLHSIAPNLSRDIGKMASKLLNKRSRNEEDRILQKLIEMLKPFIRQCVREEVTRYMQNINTNIA